MNLFAGSRAECLHNSRSSVSSSQMEIRPMTAAVVPDIDVVNRKLINRNRKLENEMKNLRRQQAGWKGNPKERRTFRRGPWSHTTVSIVTATHTNSCCRVARNWGCETVGRCQQRVPLLKQVQRFQERFMSSVWWRQIDKHFRGLDQGPLMMVPQF